MGIQWPHHCGVIRIQDKKDKNSSSHAFKIAIISITLFSFTRWLLKTLWRKIIGRGAHTYYKLLLPKVYFPVSNILLLLVAQVCTLYIGIATMKHELFHVHSHIIISYAIQIYLLKSFFLFTFLLSVRTFLISKIFFKNTECHKL